MNNFNPGGDAMEKNVVPFRKSDRFAVYRAEVLKTGEIIEKEQLGLAFLKPKARVFRLKLWMFPSERYVVVPGEDRLRYRVLCPNNNGEGEGARTHWNEVGAGEVSGSFIRLKLYLFSQEILISLFPVAAQAEVSDDAA